MPNEYTSADIGRATDILLDVDTRKWTVYQWQLVKASILFPDDDDMVHMANRRWI